MDSVHHTLCPVEALRQYVAASSHRTPILAYLYGLIPTKSLSRIHISKVLCSVIEAADPGKAPKGKDVRAMSFTMAFLQHLSLDKARRGCQWASDHSFVHHYLDHSLEEVPCTTMVGPPLP